MSKAPLLAAAIAVLMVTSMPGARAQTAVPPVPPPLPARAVADSVVAQAEDHAEGVFGAMSRVSVGGQVQDAWDDTENEVGVFTFALCDGCTYKVRLREYMVTVLELPEGEVIERADVGDGGSFRVKARGPRRLAIKPLGFGLDSNLMVYGQSGTVYPVYLRAESFNSVNVPDLFVRIVGQVSIAPVEVAGIGEGILPAGGSSVAPLIPGTTRLPVPLIMDPDSPGLAADQRGGDFVRDALFDVDALRGWGDYTLWAGGPDGEALRPETVFRDEQFTYIRFGDRWQGLELPVAYVVVDDIDEVVNTRLQGSTFIVESTRPLITLKSGLSYLCIEYAGDTT